MLLLPFATIMEPIAYCDPLDYMVLDCSPPSWECECELLSQISCDSRRLYQSLDCRGKNRAIQLAPCYCDKNEAVAQAACEMAFRQLVQYPNQTEYDEEIEDQTGQTAYNRRFGY